MMDIIGEKKQKPWPGVKKFNVEPAPRQDKQSGGYREALDRKLRNDRESKWSLK